jgi:hypothetical protein
LVFGEFGDFSEHGLVELWHVDWMDGPLGCFFFEFSLVDRWVQ